MAGLASALRTLAAAHLHKRSPHQAATAAQESCSMFRELGDRSAEADSLLQLTVAHLEADCEEEACAAAKRAQELCKALSDPRRHALTQELLQAAEHFNKDLKSGLWVPGKFLAAKVASGLGGEEVRNYKWFPQAQPGFVTAEAPQEQQMKDRKFGTAVPFQRKPFPWTGAQAAKAEAEAATETPVKEAPQERNLQAQYSPGVRDRRLQAWMDTGDAGIVA
ncbi:unnamed protein product [Effrenium voratum]|nr:unnamed protein product [Effrenium voratum]